MPKASKRCDIPQSSPYLPFPSYPLKPNTPLPLLPPPRESSARVRILRVSLVIVRSCACYPGQHTRLGNLRYRWLLAYWIFVLGTSHLIRIDSSVRLRRIYHWQLTDGILGK